VWAPFRPCPIPWLREQRRRRKPENLFGRGAVDMDIGSEVTGTTRHYDSEEPWLDDVLDARIWLGFHFRDGMDDGRAIGRQVADEVVGNGSPARSSSPPLWPCCRPRSIGVTGGPGLSGPR
jgi:hypothetical protein